MIPRLISGDFFQHWQDIAPESVDLILTDPPYGTLGRLHDWDRVPDLNRLEGIFSTLLKPTGQAVVFCNLDLMTRLLSAFTHKLTYRAYHVWKKGAVMPVNQFSPLPDAELILVFRQAKAKVSECCFNGRAGGIAGDPYFKRSNQLISPTRKQIKSNLVENVTGERWISTVIEAPGKCNMLDTERTAHPTQKPVELLKRLIMTYSNPGELILDPFAGSGSTMVAAYHSLRRSIGFEIQPDYYEMAKNRIAQNCAQTAFI